MQKVDDVSQQDKPDDDHMCDGLRTHAADRQGSLAHQGFVFRGAGEPADEAVELPGLKEGEEITSFIN